MKHTRTTSDANIPKLLMGMILLNPQAKNAILEVKVVTNI
jgi:hypothetical protein